MSIRVVVITYNSGAHLGTFLDSIPAASSLPVRVVISDNASTDGSLEGLGTREGVEILRNGRNLGYGAAANRGAAGGDERWLVIANPDVALTPGALDALVAASERWPQGGAFGPAILSPDGSLYPSARMLPSLGRGIGHATLGWVWPGNPWSTAYRNDARTPHEGPVGWLSGSFLLLDRAAFDAVGGFDENYFMYFEDVDLGDRLGRAGFANVYVPSAKVLHVGGHSTTADASSSALMARTHHQSAYRYLADRHQGLRWAPVRAIVAGGLGARYLLSRAVGRISHTPVPTRTLPDGTDTERPA